VGLKLYGLAIFLFLYFPMLIVLIFSFSPTKTMVGMQGSPCAGTKLFVTAGCWPPWGTPC
jgi:ABC-type spermidine/putrescine transport system permease subunit II